MKKKLRPSKIENIIGKAKQCLMLGLYRYTAHVENRKYERMITEEDALYVIENGWRVPIRDEFCDIYIKAGNMHLKVKHYKRNCCE